MISMDEHVDKILNALPKAENRSQLLIESYHKTQINNVISRNESMCKKCLTQWTAGQFTITIRPSNHKRKKRRQHTIERLQKLVKNTDKKSEVLKLKRQIRRLQEQNNHVAIYKCRVCSATSEVMCFKPKANKQGNHETVTAARDEQHEDTTNKARRNKAKKKKPKTAGLILPAPKKTPTPTVVHQQLSMAKLSNMLQRPTSQASKLNQFLK